MASSSGRSSTTRSICTYTSPDTPHPSTEQNPDTPTDGSAGTHADETCGTPRDPSNTPTLNEDHSIDQRLAKQVPRTPMLTLRDQSQLCSSSAANASFQLPLPSAIFSGTRSATRLTPKTPVTSRFGTPPGSSVPSGTSTPLPEHSLDEERRFIDDDSRATTRDGSFEIFNEDQTVLEKYSSRPRSVGVSFPGGPSNNMVSGQRAARSQRSQSLCQSLHPCSNTVQRSTQSPEKTVVASTPVIDLDSDQEQMEEKSLDLSLNTSLRELSSGMRRFADEEEDPMRRRSASGLSIPAALGLISRSSSVPSSQDQLFPPTPPRNYNRLVNTVILGHLIL